GRDRRDRTRRADQKAPRADARRPLGAGMPSRSRYAISDRDRHAQERCRIEAASSLGLAFWALKFNNLQIDPKPKALFAGLLQSPLTGLEPSTPSLPCTSI